MRCKNSTCTYTYSTCVWCRDGWESSVQKGAVYNGGSFPNRPHVWPWYAYHSSYLCNHIQHALVWYMVTWFCHSGAYASILAMAVQHAAQSYKKHTFCINHCFSNMNNLNYIFVAQLGLLGLEQTWLCHQFFPSHLLVTITALTPVWNSVLAFGTNCAALVFAIVERLAIMKTGVNWSCDLIEGEEWNYGECPVFWLWLIICSVLFFLVFFVFSFLWDILWVAASARFLLYGCSSCLYQTVKLLSVKQN